MRRLVLVIAALGALAQAVLLGGLLYVLSAVIGAYSMSMNGADPAHAQVALRVVAAVLVVALLALAVLLVVAAIRDRAPGRTARVLLIAGLVVQGLVTVASAVVSGAAAFAVTLVIFGLLLGALMVPSSTLSRSLRS
jgi:hypothetical protein